MSNVGIKSPHTLPTNDWSFSAMKNLVLIVTIVCDTCFTDIGRHVNVYRQTEVILTSNEKGLITPPTAVPLHVTLVLMYVVIS